MGRGCAELSEIAQLSAFSTGPRPLSVWCKHGQVAYGDIAAHHSAAVYRVAYAICPSVEVDPIFNAYRRGENWKSASFPDMTNKFCAFPEY